MLWKFQWCITPHSTPFRDYIFYICIRDSHSYSAKFKDANGQGWTNCELPVGIVTVVWGWSYLFDLEEIKHGLKFLEWVRYLSKQDCGVLKFGIVWKDMRFWFVENKRWLGFTSLFCLQSPPTRTYAAVMCKVHMIFQKYDAFLFFYFFILTSKETRPTHRREVNTNGWQQPISLILFKLRFNCINQ